MSKSYFGDKEVLEVILGGKTIYKKVEEGGGELPPPYIFTGVVNGYMVRGDIGATPRQTYNTQTTIWLPVTGGKSYLLNFPKGNRFVYQFKVGNTIAPAEAPYGDVSPNNRTITVPEGYDEMRIYFNSGADPRQTMSIQEL
ncbi:MAG: hypothetical protein [Caudoviricetes sp.]|nr:MAG: hypothetical protein [Caudoviricetes sp.]